MKRNLIALLLSVLMLVSMLPVGAMAEDLSAEPTLEAIPVEEPAVEELVADVLATEEIVGEEPVTEDPVAEEPETEAVVEEPAAERQAPMTFVQGYVRVQSGTIAYKAANKQEEAGTFGTSAVVYAEVVIESGDFHATWLKLTFDTETAKQSGAVFGTAYVFGKDVEVLDKNAVEQLSVQWSQDRTIREYFGHPLPAVNFSAKAEATLEPTAVVSGTDNDAKASTKPTITKQPASVTVAPGAAASFSVTASGTSLSYQWQYRTSSSGTWANLSTNARSSVYGMTANATCNGYQYRCVVSNGQSSVTSNAATLTVKVVAPAITKQPASVTAAPGAAASFSVTASGTSLSYQWQYRMSSSGTWANLSTNARSSVYSMTANAACNGYQYRCVVSNGQSSVTSNAATLTVKVVAPAITKQPASVTAAPGTAASFSVTASGTSLSYQWQYRTSSSGTWANLSTNAKSSVYSMTANAACNGYQYRCVVSNGQTSVASNAATLTVKVVAPTITKQPASVTAAPGTAASFSVTASGTSLSYQWQYRTSGSGTWANLSTNARSSAYSMTANAACNGYQYRCVVSNGQTSVTSNAATLWIQAPKITVQPVSVTVEIGATASFSVTASGTGLSYQWQYRTSSSGTWANLSTNARSSVYSMKASAACNGYQYRCVVSNGVSVTSSEATLTVNTGVSAPKITKHPVSVDVFEGTAVSFGVTATGSSLSYQWQYRTSGSGTWANLSTNAKSSVYSMTANTSCNGYQYRCVVSNIGGNVTSSAATLTVKQPVYRALLIGNDSYSSSNRATDGGSVIRYGGYTYYFGPLNSCVNDMNAMGTMLQGLSNSFRVTRRSNASAQTILDSIPTAFAGATENDVSLFYYSGHGFGDTTKPTNTTMEKLQGGLAGIDSEIVKLSELEATLSKVKGRVIVIIDACHSGAAISTKSGSATQFESDPSAFNQYVISAFSGQTINMPAVDADGKSNEFAQSKYIVLTACRYLEESAAGNPTSAFTWALVKGMGCNTDGSLYTRSMPADSNKDMSITLYEIYSYTYSNALTKYSGQHAMYYGPADAVLFKR